MSCLDYVVYRTFSSKDVYNCVTDNAYIWTPMPMPMQMRDADAEISEWPLIKLSGTTFFVEPLNSCL